MTPQNWLFLTSYKKLREMLLKRRTWNLVARLGPGAFETIGGHVVNVTLNVLSADRPTRDWRMVGIDVSGPRDQRPVPADEKAKLLQGRLDGKTQPRSAPVNLVRQTNHLRAPKNIVQLDERNIEETLGVYAFVRGGTTTADSPRFRRTHWEVDSRDPDWVLQQCTVKGSRHYGGRDQCLLWQAGEGEISDLTRGLGATIAGRDVWQRRGIAITYTGNCCATLYTGDIFENVICVAVPRKPEHLAALWAFCESPEFASTVRRNNQKLSVDVRYFETAEFAAARWRRIAADKYPNGLPEPYSDDPTQSIFHGHPCGSVIWDKGAKRTSYGALRIDTTVLQVAVARLLGYQWPAEHHLDMRLADEARTWVDRCGDLGEFTDADGIVCLSSIGGDPAAADRLRQLLAVAYGADWSVAMERQLLVAAAGNSEPAESIETWLRDRFFEEHCQLFHQRAFTWHIWDGRRDGFHALVNYHRLAGADGAGRRTLETLTYSHLGDWMARQEADRDRGLEGADGRLAAAQDLTCGCTGSTETAQEDHRWRASVRSLRPLEAAWRAADRLGAGYQRRCSDQHSPVHVGRTVERRPGRRRCPTRQAQDRVEEGPREGSTEARQALEAAVEPGRWPPGH